MSEVVLSVSFLTYDEERVDMHSGVWRGLHLLEYFESRLVIGPELKDVAKVESSLLEMPVRFQDLAKLKRKLVRVRNDKMYSVYNLKVLLPSILIRRLDLKRSSCEKYGIIQVLEIEKYPGQVE